MVYICIKFRENISNGFRVIHGCPLLSQDLKNLTKYLVKPLQLNGNGKKFLSPRVLVNAHACLYECNSKIGIH